MAISNAHIRSEGFLFCTTRYALAHTRWMDENRQNYYTKKNSRRERKRRRKCIFFIYVFDLRMAWRVHRTEMERANEKKRDQEQYRMQTIFSIKFYFISNLVAAARLFVYGHVNGINYGTCTDRTTHRSTCTHNRIHKHKRFDENKLNKQFLCFVFYLFFELKLRKWERMSSV